MFRRKRRPRWPVCYTYYDPIFGVWWRTRHDGVRLMFDPERVEWRTP